MNVEYVIIRKKKNAYSASFLMRVNIMRTVNIIFVPKKGNSNEKTKQAFVALLKRQIESYGTCKIASIVFAGSRAEIEVLLRQGIYDVIISSDDLPERPVGAGTILEWKNIQSSLIIFLLVDSSKKSGIKLQRFYETEFYNAIYSTDSTLAEIVADTIGGKERPKEEVFRYYGLDMIAPKNKEGRVKQESEESRPNLEEEIPLKVDIEKEHDFPSREDMKENVQSSKKEPLDKDSVEPNPLVNNVANFVIEEESCDVDGAESIEAAFSRGQKAKTIQESYREACDNLPFRDIEPDELEHIRTERGDEDPGERYREAALVEKAVKDGRLKYDNGHIVRPGTLEDEVSYEEIYKKEKPADDEGDGLFTGIGEIFATKKRNDRLYVLPGGRTDLPNEGLNEYRQDDVWESDCGVLKDSAHHNLVFSEKTTMTDELVTVRRETVGVSSREASKSAGLPEKAFLTNILSDSLGVLRFARDIAIDSPNNYRFLLMFDVKEGKYTEGHYTSGTISITSFGLTKIDSTLYVVDAPKKEFGKYGTEIEGKSCFVLIMDN